jgi:L,D-transpeptidase catalytic domain
VALRLSNWTVIDFSHEINATKKLKAGYIWLLKNHKHFTKRPVHMKNIIVLTSVLLGSSLLASELHTVSRNKSNKRVGSSPTGPVGTISIIIDKGWYATYPVVFGNNSLDDKKVEGDKNTPEGVYHINGKRVHEKWYRYLGIDYPTASDREKFNKRKQKGEIPANASIGGGIGIHGTWPHEDFVIDRYKNWTMGCISMKRDDVDEIYNFAPVGTKVTIKK